MADEVAQQDQLFDGIDVNAFIARFREKRISLGIPRSEVARVMSESSDELYTQKFVSKLECGELDSERVEGLKPLLKKSLTVKKQTGRKYIHLCMNRKKRTKFSAEVRLVLMRAFQQNPTTSFEEINELSKNLSIERQTVQVWFQNRIQVLRRKMQNY